MVGCRMRCAYQALYYVAPCLQTFMVTIMKSSFHPEA